MRVLASPASANAQQTLNLPAQVVLLPAALQDEISHL